MLIDINAWVVAAIGGVSAAVPSWVLAHGAARRRAEARIAVLEKQLALMEQVVTPISVAFQQMLIKQLTHPHTPELDELLSRIKQPGLNLDEMEQLACLLAERVDDSDFDESERDAARMLPMVMRRVKHELLSPHRKAVLVLVTIPEEELPEVTDLTRFVSPNDATP